MVTSTDRAYRRSSARSVAIVRPGMVTDSLVILGSLIILPIVGVGLLGLILAQ